MNAAKYPASLLVAWGDEKQSVVQLLSRRPQIQSQREFRQMRLPSQSRMYVRQTKNGGGKTEGQPLRRERDRCDNAGPGAAFDSGSGRLPDEQEA